MFKILSYGNGERPLNKGVLLCECITVNYAIDIADAMAKKHLNEWLGIEYPRGVEYPNGECLIPFKYSRVNHNFKAI